MSANYMKIWNTKKIVKLTLTTVVMSGLLLAITAIATGPEFNIFPISYSGETNHDYPLLDARNFSDNGSFSTSQTDHDNGVDLGPEETIEFVIYYHNGAANGDENIARNVRIRANMPTELDSIHNVSATILADNATTANSSTKGGDVEVRISGSEEQRLEYVIGSTRLFPNHGSASQTLPDGIVSGGINIGDIEACWDFSGFVKFKARVTEDVSEDGSLEIQKTVSNQSDSTGFRNSVDAEPSDTIEYSIEVEAVGGDVEDVLVRDILPSGITFINDTLEIDGSHQSGTGGLFGSGIDVGDLRENETIVIRFEAKVASDSFFDGQTRTMVNTANARGSNTSTVQDTADVRVVGTVLGSSFRLSKSAYNQTQGVNAQSVIANPGDIINYILTYHNTGDTTQSNVIIEDDLYDVLLLSDLINNGGGQLSGNTLRFDSVTVSPKVSVDKTFQVRVKEVSMNQSDFVMTNFYGNQIDVQVRPPVVKGTYIAPKSGPENWVVPVLAAIVTGAWFIRKKYPSLITNYIKN